MYHYTYLLTFIDGMRYVGAHSTKIKPEFDTCYLGSGKALPIRNPQTCQKTILGIYNSRAEAIAAEELFILANNCVASDEWYNLRQRVHDKHGSQLTPEHRELIRQTHKGRDRTAYGKKYSGEGRTPAQQAGDKAASAKIHGTKNAAKGHSGTKNSGFVPWYYITPEGAYVEIHDQTKEDIAPSLGFTARQLGHGFHYSNQHQKARTLPRKGWTFGNLPRPTVLGGD